MFPRYNRLVDSSPKRNIHCSDVIRRPSEAARLTSKFVSGWSICFSYMAARWASPRSVPGINKDQRNTCNLGFVLNKHPKQPKIPSVQATLSLSNRNSGSDALEIFQSNRSQSVFGFRNNLLGNAVVNIFGKPGHPTRKLLKMPLGRFCPLTLKPGFQRIEPVSGLVDLLTGMYFSIRINREVLDTKIDTKNSFRIIRRFFGYFDHNPEVEESIGQDQIGLPSDPIHSGFLVIPHPNRDNLPTAKSDQRDLLKPFPREDSLIVNNGPIRPELWFNGLISLVGFRYFRNGPDSQLRRKTILLSDRIVNHLMQFKFVCRMQLKDGLSYVITGLIEAVHSIQECLILLLARIKLDHQSLKHLLKRIVNGDINMFAAQSESNEWGTLLPGLKTEVSATPTPRSDL